MLHIGPIHASPVLPSPLAMDQVLCHALIAIELACGRPPLPRARTRGLSPGCAASKRRGAGRPRSDQREAGRGFPPPAGRRTGPRRSGRHPGNFEIPLVQPSDRGERLGCCSEADRFRVEFQHRTFVERLAPREALHLRDQRLISASVGRTHPDEGAPSCSLVIALQVMNRDRGRQR